MLGHYLRNLVRHGRIDPLEYYVSDRYRVVYVENPKVACTAIKQVLFAQVDYEALGQDEFHARLRCHALLEPPGGLRASYLRFSFFRHPLRRLVSCFNDKLARRSAATGPSIFHLRSQRLIFGLFAGIDVTRSGLELPDFIDAVTRIPDRLRDRHVMSQQPALRAILDAPSGFVGRQESIAEDWVRLSGLTGLPPLLEMNRTRRPQAPLAALPAPTLARLHRAFAEDYRQLGYPFETEAA